MSSFLEDAFGVHRCRADEIVRHLLEAWTSEKKAEIVARMKERHADLVEHDVAGDYDLTLWHYTREGYYVVAINSGQEDPTTVSGQEAEPRAQRLPWKKMTSTLSRWVRRYGKLLVGSTDPEKTDQYKKLLSRYFLLGIWSEHPQGGFFILPD
jgi:hypothetical protein